MLSIYFGDMPQAIYNTPTYFNNVYLDSWLEDALDQRMIKAVDKGDICRIVLGGDFSDFVTRWHPMGR